ncbi:hypothetical protein [Gabonibacter massiliensis]|uniref:golvesin C-terminal-like domain-containing protein n=1 Tax=Gabonibacter massiliensis TaxID=1720195 RepID=UPI00073F537A|nr:hypothetical protein [Gabonibacter massiliensis]
MINFRDIMLVTRYEIKIGRRNWIYNIFFVLAVLFIGYYHFYLQSNLKPFNIKMVALPSSFPLMNAYLFNFWLSLLVVFIVLELFGREREKDTLETVMVRSFDNRDYFIGKIGGITVLLMGMNLIVMGVAFFIHLFASDSPFDLRLYFFYFFSFTIPAFVFMLGICVWVCAVFRNRYFPVLFLFGLLYLFFVYAKPVEFLDLYGRMLPNGFSGITGHFDLWKYLVQRFSFLLVGTGALVSAVGFIKRLPNRQSRKIRFHLSGLVLVLCGLGIGYIPVYGVKKEKEIREIYRQTYLKYPSSACLALLSHDIICHLKGERVKMQSRLELENCSRVGLPRVFFYLNPFLNVVRIERDGKMVVFRKEHQAIILETTLSPGEKAVFDMEYEGSIDERICYLDIPDQEYFYPSFEIQSFVPGRRYCYLDSNYTLLLPECLWYPVIYPPADPSSPYETIRNKSLFSLRVIPANDDRVVSQGKMSVHGDTVCFSSPECLSGITLCTGPFEEETEQIGDWKFSILHFKGHDIFPYDSDRFVFNAFSRLEEIKEVLYPYKNFYCIETPPSMVAYYRFWKNSSEFVQPEMLFFPEGKEACPVSAKDREEEGISPMAILSFLSRFLENNGRFGELYRRFMFSSDANNHGYGCRYFIYPLFRPKSVFSSEIPVLDAVMGNCIQSSIKDRSEYEFSLSDLLEARYYLRGGASFKMALRDRTLKREVLDEVVRLKSKSLENYLIFYSSPETVKQFWKAFRDLPFQEYTYGQFIAKVREKFGVDIEDFLREWYESSSLPLFAVRNVQLVQGENEMQKFIRFYIRNSGKRDGIIEVSVTENNRPRSLYYLIGKGESKKIVISGKISRLTINTGVSANIPGEFQYDFFRISDYFSKDTVPGIYDADSLVFQSIPGEIIVDNTDKGFHLEYLSGKKLVRWFKGEQEDKYSYNRFSANNWAKLVDKQCYGQYVKDAYAKLVGNGECKAIWEVDIKEAGNYEIFVYHVPYQSSGSRGVSSLRNPVHYFVYDGKAEREVVIRPTRRTSGWISLGTYYLEQGLARVSLDDRGKSEEKEGEFWSTVRSLTTWKGYTHYKSSYSQIIIADAVKWVKMD